MSFAKPVSSPLAAWQTPTDQLHISCLRGRVGLSAPRARWGCRSRDVVLPHPCGQGSANRSPSPMEVVVRPRLLFARRRAPLPPAPRTGSWPGSLHRWAISAARGQGSAAAPRPHSGREPGRAPRCPGRLQGQTGPDSRTLVQGHKRPRDGEVRQPGMDSCQAWGEQQLPLPAAASGRGRSQGTVIAPIPAGAAAPETEVQGSQGSTPASGSIALITRSKWGAWHAAGGPAPLCCRDGVIWLSHKG